MTVEISGTGPVQIVLRPVNFADSVVVTATRGAERLPSAASSTVLTSAELSNMAAGALDDALRSTPGFTLFRRSSSRVANPTTQGVTLRGVSGSGSSRTLVLADGVPLERSVRQLGLLESHPARRGRSRGSRARRDRRSLRRRRAGRRDSVADRAAEPHARASDDRRRIARHVPRFVLRRRRRRTAGTRAAPTKASAPTASTSSLPKCAAPSTPRADSDYKTGFATFGKRGNNWHVNARGALVCGGSRQRHASCR